VFQRTSVASTSSSLGPFDPDMTGAVRYTDYLPCHKQRERERERYEGQDRIGPRRLSNQRRGTQRTARPVPISWDEGRKGLSVPSSPPTNLRYRPVSLRDRTTVRYRTYRRYGLPVPVRPVLTVTVMVSSLEYFIHGQQQFRHVLEKLLLGTLIFILRGLANQR
jgi:hypothetical protein